MNEERKLTVELPDVVLEELEKRALDTGVPTERYAGDVLVAQMGFQFKMVRMVVRLGEDTEIQLPQIKETDKYRLKPGKKRRLGLAKNARKYWTKAEDKIVREMLGAGKTYGEIAKRLGRTSKGVSTHVQKHLMDKNRYVPTNRYGDWSDEDTQKIIEMRSSGMLWSEIGKEVGRSEGACCARYRKTLGLVGEKMDRVPKIPDKIDHLDMEFFKGLCKWLADGKQLTYAHLKKYVRDKDEWLALVEFYLQYGRTLMLFAGHKDKSVRYLRTEEALSC